MERNDRSGESTIGAVHDRHAVGASLSVTSSDAASAASIGPSSAFGARYRRLMRALIDCASPSRRISTGPDAETHRSRPGSRASTTTEAVKLRSMFFTFRLRDDEAK